jgi:glutathione synthase/RimK-type ligase-like ATP-grasp enzyme
MPLSITGEQRSDPQEPSAFVLYHGASHVTGQLLGDYLGLPHGRDAEERYDYLLRWGSRSSARFQPSEGVINSRSSLSRNADKLQSLRDLDAAGIPVPDFVTDRDEISETFGYPALGRSESHARGEDINLIMQWRDAYLTDGNDYFVEYIPTELEYRMHVIDGEVVQTHEKRLRSEADNHPYIRNAETGWVFVEPREAPPDESIAVDAVGALGMDFGAVDIIRSEDGDPYVLEVNSAPSLDEANLARYGDAFAEMMALSDYPGIDNVDFPDDEEDDGSDA